MAEYPLTDDEYVATGGGKCPYCGSDEVEGGSVDIEGGGASQEVTCMACDNNWIDVYNLTGYLPEG